MIPDGSLNIDVARVPWIYIYMKYWKSFRASR